MTPRRICEIDGCPGKGKQFVDRGYGYPVCPSTPFKKKMLSQVLPPEMVKCPKCGSYDNQFFDIDGEWHLKKCNWHTTRTPRRFFCLNHKTNDPANFGYFLHHHDGCLQKSIPGSRRTHNWNLVGCHNCFGRRPDWEKICQ